MLLKLKFTQNKLHSTSKCHYAFSFAIFKNEKNYYKNYLYFLEIKLENLVEQTRT